jgi:hypothetical protein
MSEQTAAASPSSPGSRGGSSAQSTDEASIDARLDDLATSVRRIELGASGDDASGDEPGGPPSEEEPANGLARLVLSLVQLLHDVLEKQAIRRMETGRLTEEEIERVGLTLKRQAETIDDLCEAFNIDPADLDLPLGAVHTVDDR